MSTTTTKTTDYHDTEQAVKYGLKWLRIDGLDDLQSLRIVGRLSGKVGTATGEADFKEPSIGLTEIKANCTSTEKTTLKNAIAIFERELSRADDELTNETHDKTDVFIDNTPAE